MRFRFVAYLILFVLLGAIPIGLVAHGQDKQESKQELIYRTGVMISIKLRTKE